MLRPTQSVAQGERVRRYGLLNERLSSSCRPLFFKMNRGCVQLRQVGKARDAGHILRLCMLRAVNHLVDTRKWDDIAWLELISHAASTLRQP
jgi:hypothetical protein